MTAPARPRRVRVKVCGVTNLEDAQNAIDVGADALGFNFFRGSSRYVSLADNEDWMRDLPPFVTKVAVLVNASLDEARTVAASPAIDVVQFHGDEDAAYCAAFAQVGKPFIKALRLRDAGAIEGAERFSTTRILLDAHVPGAFGGTGASVDVRLAAEFARQNGRLALILAGGLTPENVASAVAAVQPFAVDVATGVECAPGRKSTEKMRAFIEAARLQ